MSMTSSALAGQTFEANLAALGEWLWPATRQLPPAVTARAQRLWMDTVSCAHAGLRAEPLKALAAAQALSDPGPVPLPGSAQHLGASAATATMALAACWDEACEGVAIAHGRPGVPIVAALWSQLAVGRALSWDDLWRATAAGYEVGARMGALLRIRPGMHVDGVWSALGAAAAVMHARGGTWGDAQQAMEAAATQLPFSLYLPVRQGANVRNTYLAHSAWLGWQAATWVGAGLVTPQGAVADFRELALNGAAHGHWPQTGRWLILGSYWKPFAAVRHVHYGAQAALRLRDAWLMQAAPEVPITAIEDIELRVYPEALQYCGNRAPQTALAAQFSLSHGVACALVHGDLSPAEFRAPRFMNEAVRTLESRVRVVADVDAFAGAQRGAILSLSGAGHRLTLRQDGVLGDEGQEPDALAVMEKFHRYSDGCPALRRWAQAVLNEAGDAPAWLPTWGV